MYPSNNEAAEQPPPSVISADLSAPIAGSHLEPVQIGDSRAAEYPAIPGNQFPGHMSLLAGYEFLQPVLGDGLTGRLVIRAVFGAQFPGHGLDMRPAPFNELCRGADCGLPLLEELT